LASVEDDWKGVGTANIHFHRELVALAGIARTDELMRSVFAELRLAFHLVDDPKALHEPYLQRNRLILQALQASDPAEAEKLLAVYLDDSLERVVDAYRQRVGEDGAALD
jgi:DNA-binding GntR family transcriptional regulator